MKTLLRQKILIMRHNKFFATAIALCVIALFTMGSVPSALALTRTPVTITGTFDFSTFPDVVGTFVTTGALTISGDTTMHVDLNYNGTTAHCVVTLIAPDGNIIIQQECQFATSPPEGRWEIVGGTGAYANLLLIGSLPTMIGQLVMPGVIFT